MSSTCGWNVALPCSAWSSRPYIAVILCHPRSFSDFQESPVTGAAMRVIFVITCQVLVSTLPAPVAKPMPWSQPNAWHVMQSGQVEQTLAPFERTRLNKRYAQMHIHTHTLRKIDRHDRHNRHDRQTDTHTHTDRRKASSKCTDPKLLQALLSSLIYKWFNMNIFGQWR